MLKTKLFATLMLGGLAAACGVETSMEGTEGGADEELAQSESEIVGWKLLRTIESAHPYADNFDQTWTVQGAQTASELRFVIDQLDSEAGYDFLSVEDATARFEFFSGPLSAKQKIVSGNRAHLHFTSDYSITGWGFKVSVYERTFVPVICPANIDPVCGVDNQTYGNACNANRAGVEIAYHMACGSFCPANIDYVCGVDNQTYGNACNAKRVGVEVAYYVACGTVCTTNYAPVCGANGITYSNDCSARRAGVLVARTGACPSAPICPTQYLPVCGTDGVTYSNACEAARAGATVASQGVCVN